jgi:hypothetical protein
MFQREPAESLGAPEQVLALGSPVAREEQRRRDSIGVRADDEDARRIAGPSGTRARHPRALPLTRSSFAIVNNLHFFLSPNRRLRLQAPSLSHHKRVARRLT